MNDLPKGCKPTVTIPLTDESNGLYLRGIKDYLLAKSEARSRPFVSLHATAEHTLEYLLTENKLI